MSIFYKLYQNTREGSSTEGMWYGRATVMGKTVSLEELAEHMANHNTPYSEGVIKGVLTDMINCIRELVLEGRAVKIPNLCIFSAGISTKPAASPKAFTPQSNVKSVYLRTRTTGKFTRDEITKKANVRELTNYYVSKDEPAEPEEGGTEEP
ncbi:MAG: DNA-binding protein [Prevotella sp.]|nr:DNA-binding protein [Prevotella sp.]